MSSINQIHVYPYFAFADVRPEDLYVTGGSGAGGAGGDGQSGIPDENKKRRYMEKAEIIRQVEKRQE